ncbi:hypothetical protein CY35_05G102700 [Sphagnum magellanicum]|nr:hypothetical protein CY35_05G102700 [Sphagnum magellanicum]
MAWGGALASLRWIIQGKHMELTDAVKNYVEEKVGNAVHNHGKVLVKEVDVQMSVRGGETGQGQKLQRCKRAFHFLTIHAVLQKAIILDKTKVCAVCDLVAEYCYFVICMQAGAHYPIHEKTWSSVNRRGDRQHVCKH